MKKHIVTFLLLLFHVCSYTQSFLINDSAFISIDSAAYIIAQGNLTNQKKGIIDNNGTIELSGNFTNNAVFDQDSGYVLLNGTTTQQIGGDTSTFYYLELNNAAGAIINSGQKQIRHTLYLTSGTLTTNDSLKLLSVDDLTARIDEINSGANINGDIIMERYLSNGVTGWHMIGAATSGGTLVQWDDDFVTSGFPGSAFPTFPFINLYTYDETIAGNKDLFGYTSPTNLSDALTSGLGYWTYIGPVPLTIDTKGPANTFTEVLPVNYTNNLNIANDGWNLIANPYPSNIDWTSTYWTKTNIDDAIYIYDPDNGVYASYISGIGTNGGTSNVASSQAFWIKANASNPVLTANEQVKTETSTTFFRKKSNLSDHGLLRISVIDQSSSLSDETVLSFSPFGAIEWDFKYDAYKLEDDYSPSPYIATVLDDTLNISINSLPSILEKDNIPVRVKVNRTGTYQLSMLTENSIDEQNCLIMEDLFNGNVIDFKTDTTYSFTISDSTDIPRFLIHGTPSVTLGPDIILTQGNEVTLDAGAGYNTYTWSNGNSSRYLTVSDSGLYRVTVKDKYGCTGWDEIQISFDNSTHSNKNDLQRKLTVFPVPANDAVYIKMEGYESETIEISIYSIIGKKILYRTYTALNNTELLNMNLSGIAAGMYNMKISGTDWVKIKKIQISN